MTTQTKLPAAGWFADPRNSANKRYWDGKTWTTDVQPLILQPPTGARARYEINPVGVGIALGAVTMIIAVFLPRAESSSLGGDRAKHTHPSR